MRILTLSYEFPPIGGGGSGVVKGLATELVLMGHTVDIVTMGYRGLPAKEVVNGVTVHRVECGRRTESKCTAREALRYFLEGRSVVASLLDSYDYDLVHAHFIFPDGALARKLAAPRSVPYIITAHGSDVPGYNAKPFFKLAHALLHALWKRVTRGSAAIISPSDTLANLIRAGDPGAQVIVIPNGMADDMYRPQQKREQIFVATRLVKRKGVQHLLRALAEGGITWPVIVGGSGEYEVELLALNERLGRPARFIGWVSNESQEFRNLLEQSSIYVLPSDYENFPVCLLEAMAAGCAIITTRGHGCEEVVGDCAELVTPGRMNAEACVGEIRGALKRLTSDSAHCGDLGIRARRRLEENFTWSAVARRYVEVYRECVGVRAS